MRTSTFWLLVLVVAVVGLSIFASVIRQSVDFERVDAEAALREFGMVQDSLGTDPPMLSIDASGRPVRDPGAGASRRPAPSRLRALVYLVDEGRLARAEVPLWFFKLKGPAVQLALKPTGIDLHELGVTAADLEAHGAGLVLDTTRPGGDRVMIWTE